MALQPRLEMRGIVRRFDGGAGVHGVSFAVAPGEVVCLLGPSGCGKSTTLRIAAGVERASQGEVWVDGVRFQAPGCWVPPEKRGVGLMFQDYALFPHLNVLRNVMFGLDGLSRAKAEAIAREGLARVGLAHLANAYPHVLSGGEQQRVALARALAPGPKLMLMDEPFSGLDERLRDEVREAAMAVLAEAGASALVVTHDPEEAMAIANRIVLLRKGLVVQDASPDTIYAKPADLEAAKFFSPHTEFSGQVSGGMVATPFGPVAAAMPEGSAAIVAIRPEAVVLLETGGVPVHVASARRAGPDLVLDLETGFGKGAAPFRVRARLRTDKLAAAGDIVNAGLDAARLLVFPAA
jgi:iron(III) transport system ATP-binding protein